ncbi:hypothetical protein [Blastococcus xanthinilyticus]|uniref:Uncharacterized protein n=1 Tax=Blastococcus xanthinilyticus TaxID=1564164 RepID=A0A5S5CW14_9ACTN|nr:hypothetical protein [Blastococcus xanthinilyticus]TYP86742.1 hypothetical protein BD833_10827 [Blastococcus xanthinilyticus]
MTASLFTTGTCVGWTGRDPRAAGAGSDEGVAHAVARPVVDGLASSVCGLLVIAAADLDWMSVGSATRCEECARVVG